MELQTSKVNLLLDVDQNPPFAKGLLLSLQHVFAMFGATILVPLILGMPVSVALFASGLGTLIYMVATQFKVPVYLGSSFAFISAMAFAMKQMNGDVSAAQSGVVLVGLVYVVVALAVKLIGTKWIDCLLPPIVIGPMIMVIGLGLANSAVTNAGFIKDGTISALGLDSAEKPFPPHLFVECYGKAASLNKDLKLTAHAGEEGPAQFVSDALDLLQVTRIDHGINSQYDEELLDRLSRDQTMLTICPFSNVKLQVVQSVSELPLQKFLDRDVPFSLNSDDPTYFGGYILDVYTQVSKDFPHWDHETWGRIAKNAIKGSWCDDKRKNGLLSRVDEVVTKYSH